LRIITIKEFKERMGGYAKDLQTDKVILVANETYKDKSFLMIAPSVFLELEPMFLLSVRDKVIKALAEVSEKVSQKYRKIRKLRG